MTTPLRAATIAGVSNRAELTTSAAKAVSWRRVLGWGALAAAMAFAVSLSCRKQNSPDLGYHLAYGERFLNDGEIVDTNEFIYTNPADAGDPATAPGGWYDFQTGRLHFPNANYASQIAIAATHRVAGMAGLSILQMALWFVIFILLACAMLGRGVSPPWAGLGLLLAGVAAYERFNLRPETFAYLFLASELCVLLLARPTWRAAAVLVLLQWAWVQFHSSWILGVGLTGCFLIGASLRRVRGGPAGGKQKTDENDRRRLIWWGAAVGGQIILTLVNPWTWRLAIYPVQTLLYLQSNHIIGGGPETLHPWAYINEFQPAFAQVYSSTWPTYAFVAVLAMGAVGAVASLARRRWGPALAIAGFAIMALPMRRNIAPASLVIVPLSLAALGGAAAALRESWKNFPRNLFSAVGSGVAVVTLLLAVLGLAGAATNHLYYRQNQHYRFGLGVSPLPMPLEACRAVKKLPRDVRVFTSFNASSGVLYFSRQGGKYRPMPLLTNGWATPPAIMRQVNNICLGRLSFANFATRYNVGIVVLDCIDERTPLLRKLMADPQWQPVHVDARYVVFARSDLGDHPQPWRDADKFIKAVEASDPNRAYALNEAAKTLYRLGEFDYAIDVWRKALERDSEAYETWNLLGRALAQRGTRRLQKRDDGGRDDWKQARTCFQRSLSIKPGYAPAAGNLALLDDQIDSLNRGILLVPGQ